jgi:hypothetical protein
MKPTLQEKLAYILKHGGPLDARLISRIVDRWYLKASDPAEHQRQFNEGTKDFLKSEIARKRKEIRGLNKKFSRAATVAKAGVRQ